MLSEAKARSFCGTPPVADPSEAPMNRWSPYFLSIVSQTLMSAGASADVLTGGIKLAAPTTSTELSATLT